MNYCEDGRKKSLFYCENHDCEREELEVLGHRIVYDSEGHSTNIFGVFHPWLTGHDPKLCE